MIAAAKKELQENGSSPFEDSSKGIDPLGLIGA